MAAGLLGILSLSLSSCIKEDVNPAIGTVGTTTSLYNLRQAYNGSDLTLDAAKLGGGTSIQGVVISDATGGNGDANTVVLQQTIATANAATDVTRGIAIQMTAAPTYTVGDSLQVDVMGAKLTRVNGTLTLSGVAADKVSVLATGKIPTVRAVTQGILQSMMDQYESTLVSINADVTDYAAGATIAGTKQLNDYTGAPVYVHTQSGAAFASTALPMNAQFRGIATFRNEGGNDTSGAKKVILPRNAGDIQFASGVIYPGFPESFESPDASTKTSYNTGTNIVALATGNWTLMQAILGNTLGSDRINMPGKQSIRMQQNLTTSGFLQMNFDVPDGASKVTVFYGRYGSDARSSFRLEYSTNGGTTWTALGSNITDHTDKLMRQAVWTMNITVPVRFRINKLGTGTSNNGRLNLDDFVIYKR